MISYLQGKILYREPGRVIINTGSIGYTIFVDQKTELKMGAAGSEQELYCAQIVRENEVSLFGFDSLIKLEVFEMLLKANKVGPKVALSFLSSLTPEEILEAIRSEEISAFGKIPGAGKKLQTQVILDCKNHALRIMEKRGKISVVTEQEPMEKENHQVVLALQQLGFTRSEIRDCLKAIENEISKLKDEQAVSACLRHLWSNR